MTAIRERIEDSDLDCRMAVQRNDLLIAGNGVPIVDQYAHAHSAIGRPQQSLCQQPPGLVAAKNEILQVQGAFRRIDHLYPGQEPVDPDRYDAKSGSPTMFTRRACELSAQAGFVRMSERHGGDLGKIRTGRKPCAATKDRGDEYGKRKAPAVCQAHNSRWSARGCVSDRARAPDPLLAPAPGRSPARGRSAPASATAVTRAASPLARAAPFYLRSPDLRVAAACHVRPGVGALPQLRGRLAAV